MHVYTEKSDPNPGNFGAGKYVAYACTMGPLAGSLDGVRTFIYHTFDGGSLDAYAPHLFLAGENHPFVPGTLKRLKKLGLKSENDPIFTANCDSVPIINQYGDETFVNCSSESVSLSPNINAFTVPTLPQGGFSDIEYTMHKNNLAILMGVSETGGEEYPTYVGQGFGLAVSYRLYAELQKSQGLVNTTAIDGEACDANYAAGTCQPNINRQKYSSLVSAGNVTNKDGSLFGAAAGSVIKVERRVGTSGTQSASNAFFLNRPCATGDGGGERSPAGSDYAGTLSYNGGKVLVTSHKSSSDVKKALANASAASELAIGVLSLENKPNHFNLVDGRYAYVKLNGVSPNTDAKQRQTAIEGDYEFWYEIVGFVAAPYTGNGHDLIGGIVSALGDPSLTDLTGLFVTRAAGMNGSNVSKGYKDGNACSTAVQ